jgi:hypothetical protein
MDIPVGEGVMLPHAPTAQTKTLQIMIPAVRVGIVTSAVPSLTSRKKW